jgi:hypothetical protein
VGGYRVRLGEPVMAVLAAMDEATHELFVMALVDLGLDPHKGRAFGRKPGDTERALPLGSHGLIVYALDEVEREVKVLTVLWIG